MTSLQVARPSAASSPSAYTTVGGEGILAVASAAGSVSIMSSKTLAKIRSVSLFQGSLAGATTSVRRKIIAMSFISGFRHNGDQMSTSGGSSVCLHVVDNCGAYYTICTKTYVVCVAPTSILQSGGKDGSERIVTQASWSLVSDLRGGGVGSQSPSELCVVCVSPSHGVLALEVRALLPAQKVSASAAPHTPLQLFAPVTATESLLLSTSPNSGILHVAETGRRWIVAMQLTLVAGTDASGKQVTTLHAGSPSNFLVPCDVHTLASHPTLASGGVAVGGSRGEISLVANSTTANPITFSDHWHFGPLSALTFTADGRTLLSGGSEQVLVSWNVGGSFARSKVTRVFSAEGGSAAASGEWSSASPIVGIQSLGLSSISCDAAKTTALSVWGSGGDGQVYGGTATTAPALVLFGDSSLAAVDPLEHRTLATASGAQWVSPPTMSTQRPCGQDLVWKGRAAVMVCVGDCVRYCDPTTHEALHSAVVRFRPEASAVGVDGPAAPTALLASCTKDGKLLFTYEDLAPIGLPSVLKIWEFQIPSTRGASQPAVVAGRHVLIQTIAAPHGTDSRGMVALRVDEGPGRLRLFSADRGSIKCWAPTQMGAHELASTAADAHASAGKATTWSAVGTSVFPSRRLSDIAISADGSVCAACDDTVHFFAIAVSGAVDDKSVSLELREAREWTRVLHLAQTHTTAVLYNLNILGLEGGSAAPQVVASSVDGKYIFVWALNIATGVWDYSAVPVPTGSSGYASAVVMLAPDEGAAATIYGLVASDASQSEVSHSKTFHVVELTSSSKSKKDVSSFTTKAIPHTTVVLSCSSDVASGTLSSSKSLYVVDGLGLQVVPLSGSSAPASIQHAAAPSTATATVSTYFQTPVIEDVATVGEVAGRGGKGASSNVNTLVALGVLAAEAYTCPSVATVLSALLNE